MCFLVLRALTWLALVHWSVNKDINTLEFIDILMTYMYLENTNEQKKTLQDMIKLSFSKSEGYHVLLTCN